MKYGRETVMARREIYRLCRQLGICTCCESKKAVPGMSRCERCAAKKREYNRAYMERRRNYGKDDDSEGNGFAVHPA